MLITVNEEYFRDNRDSNRLRGKKLKKIQNKLEQRKLDMQDKFDWQKSVDGRLINEILEIVRSEE